jgi:hypothetical protein
MNEPSASGAITVNASPDAVFGLITDVEHAGWVQECTTMNWLDGAAGPAVGARFRGRNRNGVRRWSTVSTVTGYEPGRRFGFSVRSLGVPVADWRYDLSDVADGCQVVESTWDRRPRWFLGLARVATGVRDRASHNQRNIAASLAALKRTAEE